MIQLKLILKLLEKIRLKLVSNLSYIIASAIFQLNHFEFSTFHTVGIPFVVTAMNSQVILGKNLKLNNCLVGNYIGFSRCVIAVQSNAILRVGDNVGMSSVVLAVHNSLVIGNNTNIGAGTRIFDSDFHSLDHVDRRCSDNDQNNKKSLPIVIGDDVFIGANTTILKGVQIGSRSIIGAGSVVVCSIPPDEIWGGNPAKYIKSLTNKNDFEQRIEFK